MSKHVFHESDVIRDGQGQFADKPGGPAKKATSNTSFFAKFSAKIGATDDPATAKAKVAAAGQAWNASAPKKTGAFDALKVGKKAAPVKAAPSMPATLPVKKAVAKKVAAKKAAPAAPKMDDSPGFKDLTPAQAAAMQRKMLKGNPWTPAQRGALRTYTGESYTKINGGLRKGNATAKIEATIGNARAGLRPIPQDVNAYRGMGSGTAFGFVKNRKITKAQLDELVGKSYHDPGFTSTATEGDGYGYGQRIRAKIAVPAGTRGAFVEGITQNKGENELVLDAGTHYRISGYEQAADGKVTLYMEVVKQDD